MTRIAFVVTYLASAAAVVLLNANTGNDLLPVAIWAVASGLLGWGTGQPAFALLAFLAIPFSVPFGLPDHAPSHDPLPVWTSAMYGAFCSSGLIFCTVLIRRFIEIHRRQHPSP